MSTGGSERLALLLALVALAVASGCMQPPSDEPLPPKQEALLAFAPIGPETFLLESSPADLESRLRRLAETTGPRRLTETFSNQWVQPPGWSTTVSASGEVLPGDLFGDRGFPFRTNLVEPASGVVVLAYTRTPPDDSVRLNEGVRVTGRLEGWLRQGPGVLVLVDASFAPPGPSAATTPAS